METPPSVRERRRWARAIDKTIVDSERFILYRQHRPLTQARVVAACAPALREIAAVLRDEQRPIARTALQELQAFLTDTILSPPYKDNPISARWAAAELRNRFPT